MEQASSLRWIVYALGALHTAFVVYMIVTVNSIGQSDPLGRSIAMAVTAIVGAPWLLLTLPAMILARRSPRLALGLMLAAYAVTAVAWVVG